MLIEEVSIDERTWQQRCAQARARMRDSGTSIRDWSDRHGFSPRLVYLVLAGRRRCFRGTSHRIAVELGLKPVMAAPASETRMLGVDRRSGAVPCNCAHVPNGHSIERGA